MLRAFAVALLVLTGVAVAAPVPKAIKKSAVPPVAGTSWVGSNGNTGSFEYTFHEGGQFTAEQNGRPYSKGTWKQDGDALEWEFNNRYSVYTVTFAKDAFDGTAVNVRGKSWPVTLKAIPK